ncbi:Uncharacterised protein [Vibrio cholerae]|nr:Uncharacterised protein [Vibrio cholerae]
MVLKPSSAEGSYSSLPRTEFISIFLGSPAGSKAARSTKLSRFC